MRKLKSIALMLSIMAALTALPASFLLAHHSTTHFSKEFTEMEGTLVELRWRYPHIYFVLEVTEDNGEKVTWQMEAGTVYMLGRAGVTRDMFEIGDELRVAGNRSTLFEDKFWLTNVLLPAGRLSEERVEVLVVARGNPRWADELVGGRDKWSDTAFRDSSGIEKGKGFFRVWSPPGANSVTAIVDPNALPLAEIATAAAKAVKETWDPYVFDAACELPGLPKVMHGPHPHQFIDGGDQILFVSGGYNVTRTLHLQSVENPLEQPFSPLGYSIANWKNEHTLLVETTRINYPYLDLGGYGQSEQVVLKERYTLSEDQSRMDYKVTITDPVMLTAPFIKTGVWVDLNEGMVKYDCVLTSAAQ
ncbi:MAG: DUF6152 family protein [Arenicellaceae bacterium]|nr:DUF6152 family protein [Arenicellaceae bacterium]